MGDMELTPGLLAGIGSAVVLVDEVSRQTKNCIFTGMYQAGSLPSPALTSTITGMHFRYSMPAATISPDDIITFAQDGEVTFIIY